MPKNVLLIQGHPDSDNPHLCHALAAAYRAGALASGHEVRELVVADLNLPCLRKKSEFESASDDPVLQAAQDDLQWATHMVLLFPLWLGEMPALLKGFLEQMCRPRAGIEQDPRRLAALLKGKSARIVITMGMPALLYRFYFGAHGLKNLKRNILQFVGVKPVRSTLIGMVESMPEKRAGELLAEMRALGSAAK